MGRVTFAKVSSSNGKMLVNVDAVGAVVVRSDGTVRVLAKDGGDLIVFSATPNPHVLLRKTVAEIQDAADEHNANLPDGVL
jgi:hypothetical protein